MKTEGFWNHVSVEATTTPNLKSKALTLKTLNPQHPSMRSRISFGSKLWRVEVALSLLCNHDGFGLRVQVLVVLQGPD